MSQTQVPLPVQSTDPNDDLTSLPSTPAALSSPYKDETPFTITTSAMESDNDVSPWIPNRTSSCRGRHKQRQFESNSSPIQGKDIEDVLDQLLTTPDTRITDTPSDFLGSSQRPLRRTGRSTVLNHRNAKIYHTPPKQHARKISALRPADNKSRDEEVSVAETPKVSRKRMLGQMSPTSSLSAVHNLETPKKAGSGSISLSSIYSSPLLRHKHETQNEGSPSYIRKRQNGSRGLITYRGRSWRCSRSSVKSETPRIGRLDPGWRPPTTQEIDESIARMVAFHNWLKPPSTSPVAEPTTERSRRSAKELTKDIRGKEKNKREKLKDMLKRWFRRRKLSFGWPAPNESESTLPRLELLPVVNEKNGKTRLEPFPKGIMRAFDGYLQDEASYTPVASVAGSISDIKDGVGDYSASRNQPHNTHGHDTDDHDPVHSAWCFNACLDGKGTFIDDFVEGGYGPIGNVLAATGGLDDEVVMAL